MSYNIEKSTIMRAFEEKLAGTIDYTVGRDGEYIDSRTRTLFSIFQLGYSCGSLDRAKEFKRDLQKHNEELEGFLTGYP